MLLQAKFLTCYKTQSRYKSTEFKKSDRKQIGLVWSLCMCACLFLFSCAHVRADVTSIRFFVAAYFVALSPSKRQLIPLVFQNFTFTTIKKFKGTKTRLLCFETSIVLFILCVESFVLSRAEGMLRQRHDNRYFMFKKQPWQIRVRLVQNGECSDHLMGPLVITDALCNLVKAKARGAQRRTSHRARGINDSCKYVVFENVLSLHLN